MISTTGRFPHIAAPTHAATIASSEIGVSMTLPVSLNSFHSPWND